MGGAQIGVGLVERMAAAIAVEVDGLGAVEGPDLGKLGVAALVDVVAQLQDQVGLGGDDVAIGAEPSQFEMLARGDRQSRRRRMDGRRHRASDLAGRSQRMEAIPVRPARAQAGDLDMDGVGEGGGGGDPASPDDRAKAVVRRDFIGHRHGRGVQGLPTGGRQPGP